MPADVTASSGTSVVLTSAAVAGDEVNVYAFSTFNVADTYSQAAADARFVQKDASGNVGVRTTPVNNLDVLGGGSYSAAVDMPNAQLRLKHSAFPVQLYAGLDHVSRFAYIQASETGIGYRDLLLNPAGGNVQAGGNFQMNSGYGSVATAYGCRAWVNFNGTGTVAIRASGNVSSIADNGSGEYTVNLTNNLPDTNYTAVVCGTGIYGTLTGATYNRVVECTPVTVNTVKTLSYAPNNGVITDVQYVAVAIFR